MFLVAQVELAAGLHCGWAIEGTVGSELKLDATYLSPNVNLAARIETATQQFGVHLMMSDQYYQARRLRRCSGIVHAYLGSVVVHSLSYESVHQSGMTSLSAS